MSNVDELVEEVARVIAPTVFRQEGAPPNFDDWAEQTAKAAIKAVLMKLKSEHSVYGRIEDVAIDWLLAELEDKPDTNGR